jgi:hypothetical protein
MSFTKQQPRTPTSIGLIQVMLSSQPDGIKAAGYSLIVLDQDGNRIPYDQDSGDLVPYLTTNQLTALISFMDDLRTLATAGIIGTLLK